MVLSKLEAASLPARHACQAYVRRKLKLIVQRMRLPIGFLQRIGAAGCSQSQLLRRLRRSVISYDGICCREELPVWVFDTIGIPLAVECRERACADVRLCRVPARLCLALCATSRSTVCLSKGASELEGRDCNVYPPPNLGPEVDFPHAREGCLDSISVFLCMPCCHCERRCSRAGPDFERRPLSSGARGGSGEAFCLDLLQERLPSLSRSGGGACTHLSRAAATPHEGLVL